tara:strand:+ start:1137 stop:1352 length:216 start_codon:yes stop_codon:yes gene_type:complete
MTKAELEKRLIVAETMFMDLYKSLKLEDISDDVRSEMLDYKIIITPITRCSDNCKNCKEYFDIKYNEIVKE